MYVSDRTLRRRVQRGVKLLDERVPNWRRVVHTWALDLEECETCVLGQLFGDFYRAANLLDLSERRLISHGFNFDDDDHSADNFERLTSEWRKALRDV